MFEDTNGKITIRAAPQPDGGSRLTLPAGSVLAEMRDAAEGEMRLRLDGVQHRVRVVRHGSHLVVIIAGRNHAVRFVDPLAPPRAEMTGSDRLTAPIPARVARILAAAGDVVTRGTPLVVLEAMKMELTLSAPMDGTIERVHYAVNDMVQEGAELLTFATETGAERAG